jgi:membrane protease YdiL (CAAX protease family)
MKLTGLFSRTDAAPLRPAARLLLLAGAVLVVLPDALAAGLSRPESLLLRMAIAVMFLALLVLARRTQALRNDAPVWTAYFVATMALLFDWYFSNWLVRLLGIHLKSPVGYAVDKVEGAFLIAMTIVGLTLISGGSLASLYLKRGKLAQWFTIGIATFVFFAVSAPLAIRNLFYAESFTVAAVAVWAPWLLVFVLANALGEELIFRGLLLSRLERVLGGLPAVLVVTAVFTLWHAGASYAVSPPFFLAIVFVLGLGWAYVVRSTDSLWGAVLFHAGADIPVVIGVFSLL